MITKICLSKRIIVGFAIIWFANTDCFVHAQNAYESKDAVLLVSEAREIPSLVSGLIQHSDIREGSLIEVGQTLMQIDDKLVRLELDKLKRERDMAKQEAATTVELDYAKRSIQVARAELTRALESNQRLPGAVARSEIDQLSLVVERSVAEKDKTEFEMQMKEMLVGVRSSEVQMGEKKLADHQIRSPVSGRLVEVLKKPGEWVEASEPVARVVQLSKLKTEIKVPASLALDHLENTPATWTPQLDSLAGKNFQGRVVFVYPEVNPVNGKVRVWVEIENPNLQLVPGLTGTVRLNRDEAKKSESESVATR